MEKRDFLLEINVEDLPAGYVTKALNYLETSFHDALRINHNLVDTDLKSSHLGTKDMLTVYIKDILTEESATEQEEIGPPKSIAVDAKGDFTKPAIGFAKKLGVRVQDLKIKSTPKGEYVVVKKINKARKTKDILEEIIPSIIKNTPFPKTMRWDDSGVRFARPIESIAALFGGENISVKIGNVCQKQLKSTTPEKYISKRKKETRIDFIQRREIIKKIIFKALDKLGAHREIDETLLEEVNFMVNSPAMFVGKFDKKFLGLPVEVLKASMSKYQRVFPVLKKGDSGELTNNFIAVIEDGKRDMYAIKKVYENILDARLKDSLFFFEEDAKKPLSENISQLNHLIFQKDLGNMFEKIERLRKLSEFICRRLKKEDLINSVSEAARLSKADLVTHMVGEFPSLQGTMGREYALRCNKKKEIALAIGEHYLPRGLDDNLPRTMEGAILAVSDKIDNIVGFVGIGTDISGSFDPFGIRRNTLGLIRIIKEKAMRFKLDELIQEAIDAYASKLKIPPVQLKDKIVKYIKERIDFLTADIKETGLKEAVFEAGLLDIVDIFNRIKELSFISNKRYFLEAAKVVERTSNILKGAKGEKIGEVDEGLFKEDLERDVWKSYLGAKVKVQKLIDREQYKEATKEYGQAFFKVLHEFFDKVLVNVEDRSLRINRLAMMKAINRLYSERVADLAKLPQIVVE